MSLYHAMGVAPLVHSASEGEHEDARKDTNCGVDRYVVVQVLGGKDRDGDGLVRCSRLAGACWSRRRSVEATNECTHRHDADSNMLLDVCGETACEHDKLNGHGGHILKGPGLTNRQKRLSRVRRCGVAWCGPGRMISSPRPSKKAKTCKKRPDTWTVCGRKYYTFERLRTRAWMTIEWHIRRVHRALQRSRQGRGRGTKCGG